MCKIIHLFILVLPMYNAIISVPGLRVNKCVLALTLQSVSLLNAAHCACSDHPHSTNPAAKSTKPWEISAKRRPLHHGENAKHVTASFVFDLAHEQTIWLAGRLSRYGEAHRQLVKVCTWKDVVLSAFLRNRGCTQWVYGKKTKKGEWEIKEERERHTQRKQGHLQCVHLHAAGMHIQWSFHDV